MLGKLVHELLELEDGSWSPISILHRVMREGNVTRAGKPSDRILCRESSREARFVAPAFNALSAPDQFVVITKHSPRPPGIERWQDQDKAHWLGVSKSNFSQRYKRIVKKVNNSLDK